MGELDRILEKEYSQQRERLTQLDKSVNELREVSAQGAQTAVTVRRLTIGASLLVFLVLSIVMLYDPRARPWYYLLVFCLAIGGAWSYWRKQQG